MEQLGTLPSAEAVLNKLKSDGTFDQFRKTCLASIEAEVRANNYGICTYYDDDCVDAAFIQSLQ